MPVSLHLVDDAGLPMESEAGFGPMTSPTDGGAVVTRSEWSVPRLEGTHDNEATRSRTAACGDANQKLQGRSELVPKRRKMLTLPNCAVPI